jgi:hypothetical protein
MVLNWNEIKSRALRFSKTWADASNEDSQAKPFWPGALLVEHKPRGKNLDDAVDQAIGYLPNQPSGGKNSTPPTPYASLSSLSFTNVSPACYLRQSRTNHAKPKPQKANRYVTGSKQCRRSIRYPSCLFEVVDARQRYPVEIATLRLTHIGRSFRKTVIHDLCSQ